MASLFEAPEVEFNLQARRLNEPLFEFFKRKTAAQIDLSLNQVSSNIDLRQRQKKLRQDRRRIRLNRKPLSIAQAQQV
jgi:hypothetical protein